MIWFNPEFVRLRRSKLRLKNTLMLGGVSAIIYGAILLIMYLSLVNGNGFRSFTEMLRVNFFTTVGIQLFSVVLYGVMLAAQNVTLEKERGTYDFQRLVGMGPFHLTLGKLLGCSVEAWCVAGVGFFFALFAVAGGAIPPLMFLEIQTVVLLCGISCSAFGLACSSIVSKTSQSTGVAVLIGIVGFIATGMAMNGSGTSFWGTAGPVYLLVMFGQKLWPRNYSGGVADTFTFFGLVLPVMCGFILNNLLYTALFFGVAVRRIADEELSYIRPRHAVLLFAVIQILLIGSMWDNSLLRDEYAAIQSFNFANLILLSSLAFAMSPSPELLKSRISRGKPNDHWKILYERSNRLQDSPAWFAICAFSTIYFVLSVGLALAFKVLDGEIFGAAMMVACVGVATGALLLYTQSFKSSLIFLFLAYVVPPSVVGFSNMFIGSQWNRISLISPVAYIFSVQSNNAGESLACPLICLVLAVSLTILAALNIRFQLDINEAEREKERKERAANGHGGVAPEMAAARLLATKTATSQSQIKSSI